MAQLPPCLYTLTVSIPVNNTLSAKAKLSWTQTPALQTASSHYHSLYPALGSDIPMRSMASSPMPSTYNLLIRRLEQIQPEPRVEYRHRRRWASNEQTRPIQTQGLEWGDQESVVHLKLVVPCRPREPEHPPHGF